MLKPETDTERNLLARAPALMQRAIGKSITVRSAKLPKKVTVTGIIVAVEPARFETEFKGFRSYRALLFRVTVEAGLNKTKHVFTLKRLPQ